MHDGTGTVAYEGGDVVDGETGALWGVFGSFDHVVCHGASAFLHRSGGGHGGTKYCGLFDTNGR